MIYLMDFIDKSTDQSLYSNKEIKKEINSYNIRIFGSDFVKKNENKVKLAINNKKRKIKEKISRKEFTGDNIKIKIIFDKTKLNYSYMFENSIKWKEISIIIKEQEPEEFEHDYDDDIEYNKDNDNDNNDDDDDNNTISTKPDSLKNVTRINTYRNPYNKPNLNKVIIGITKVIEQNRFYVAMDRMFYNCLSLLSLSDLSKWNTENVTNMSGMFYNCSSLLSLPDISKWNTYNVTWYV